MTWTLEDILALRETEDVEFKKASGRDGKGALPNDLWETYSAFANTDGGDIFLGIEENKDKSIAISGIPEFAKIRQSLFDLANNRQKISANLLHNNSVEEITLNGKTILRVHVPRANRRVRPVYVGENPLRGSYKRRNEGDYVMDESAVKRMLAEQGEDSVDARIINGYTVEDLDQDTLTAYRSVFASRIPDHPFLSQPLIEFLRSIGAWKLNRDTQVEGITLAGLLMFGKLRPILDELPNYILDYQERPEAKTENRWIDRITTDGSWPGNLYEFYRRVYPKLTGDLKVPFKLEGATRIDVTPVHEALRESLVNTLIHADFSGRVSILVVKRPDMFGFRNPGLMRVPIEQAIQGGDSDCRNRNLQKMFQFIGAGEQAGSGIPKIYQNWKQQHWRSPRILEKREPEQTLFELHMTSLLPQAVIDKLDQQFGSRFRSLPELERLALVVAESEGMVDHRRLKEISPQHPADISKSLNNLVKNGFIKAGGSGRGAFYYLEGSELDTAPESSVGLPSSSVGLASSSVGLPSNSVGIDQKEVEISLPAQANRKLGVTVMQEILVQLCDLRPQPIKRLSELLNRSPDYLRHSAIKNLMNNNALVFLYQDDPNHPEQAYLTTALSQRLRGNK